MSEEILSALITQTDREKINNVLEELKSYRQVTITNDSELVNANTAITDLKRAKKDMDEIRKTKIEPFKVKTDHLNGVYQPVIKAIQNGINNIDVGMGIFYRKKQIEDQKEQARRDAEARELQRKKDEAAQKELEKVKKYEEEGRIAMKEKAEARAESLIEQAETTVAAQVEEVKLAGTHFVKNYHATIKSKRMACEYLLSFPQYEDFVTIDIKKVEKQQKMSNGKEVFPGIEFRESLSSRTRT